ncbi:MAG: hypothetical protein WDZ62_00455 [Candidatus Pacearchaeota archaeon]
MLSKLVCQLWMKNPKDYFLNKSLITHINEHPLEESCIEYFVKNKFIGYRNSALGASAFLKIENEKWDWHLYNKFLYSINFNKNLLENEKIGAFIHEITHAHYLKSFNVTEWDEKLISSEGERFLSENEKFCVEMYELSINKLWKNLDKDNSI